MASTTLSSKGQIVLPKSIRDSLDWRTGTKLRVERTERGITVEPDDGLPVTSIDDVIGMFKVDRPISDAEIERAIEEGYRSRWRRKQ